ncbi:DUF2924 domain-containing protein [Vandammella animalimorsus]|uniref:Elements of external origin n=1 Tax=Vandammella animalimorsus TaxID=2029117 RepID=A0A2A2AUB6_9BURK|nr:DUF2924 domain-containing protein [Vandammella animalimorsus]PAT41321.1 elements of external origin [Vandammella animalimorsus]RRD44799.1 DUF2924 domain-containing protein [Comamonadaceae bacterium OH3737_COT-264]
MTAHAAPNTSIALQIARIPHLSMEDLWQLWDEYFDERPSHHHRGWLESRLAYKIQERAFGGLKPSLRKKLEEIGETGLLPKQLRGDAQRLLPGTVLTRVFDDIEHRVLVRAANDFEYQGQRFKSLSAVARHITGTQWSGPLFFGLKAPATKKVTA